MNYELKKLFSEMLNSFFLLCKVCLCLRIYN